MNKILFVLVCAALILPGCGTTSNTAKGDATGNKSGAATSTAIGADAGALIGKRMDKKAVQLAAQLEDANVEVVTDANDLKALKVTFESGILFKTSSFSLSDASRSQLEMFARDIADMPDTDLTILGHTDNTGTPEYNEKLSIDRAESVASYLNKSCGIDKKRMTIEGRSFHEPVADNATIEGRLHNRRVEIYLTANEKMIQDAENGELN